MTSLPRLLPVDNAAQIFVNIISEGETTLSRIALIMAEPVDRDRLQKALENVVPVRFPYFQVYLKKSFFSYVLERTDDIPKVEEDSYYTNRYIDFHDSNFLFRFRTDGKAIALELSHILSDGYGTFALLFTVAAEYLRLGGIDVEDYPMIFDLEEPVDPAEWRCGYADVFDTKGPPQKVGRAAYIPGLKGPAIPFDRYHTTRYLFDASRILSMARERGVTIAEFMSGIYFWGLQQLYIGDLKARKTRPGKPLRFQYPVNLRRDYPTKSMKNFSYIFSPEMRLFRPEDAMDVEAVIRLVAAAIKTERQNHEVENQIRRNLRASANPLLKYMPRVLKERFLAVFYQIFARRLFSGVLTNLGEIVLPPALDERVEAFDIVACNTPAPGRNSTLFSYHGVLEMNIASTVDDTRLEDVLAEKLRAMGIPFELIAKRGPMPE